MTKNFSRGKAAAGLLSLALATVFAIGLLGGLAGTDAAAQVSGQPCGDPADPSTCSPDFIPCALPPFDQWAAANQVPMCGPTAEEPTSTQPCFSDDLTPYEGESASECINAVALTHTTCRTSQQWVVVVTDGLRDYSGRLAVATASGTDLVGELTFAAEIGQGDQDAGYRLYWGYVGNITERPIAGRLIIGSLPFSAAEFPIDDGTNQCDAPVAVEFDFVCDGRIFPYAYGEFGLLNDDPTSVTVTTEVRDSAGTLVEIFDLPVNATTISTAGDVDYWEYAPGRTFSTDDPAPSLNQRGEFTVTMTVTGLDSNGEAFNALLSDPDPRINNDCGQVTDISCTSVSGATFTNFEPPFPSYAGRAVFTLGEFGQSASTVISLNSPEAFSAPVDGANGGLFRYRIRTVVDADRMQLGFDDDTGPRGGNLRFSRVEYDAGEFACLVPSVQCESGQAVLRVTFGDTDPNAAGVTEFGQDLTATAAGRAPDIAWPNYEWNLTDLAPGSAVDIDISHALSTVEVLGGPLTVPDCQVSAGYTCEQGEPVFNLDLSGFEPAGTEVAYGDPSVPSTSDPDSVGPGDTLLAYVGVDTDASVLEGNGVIWSNGDTTADDEAGPDLLSLVRPDCVVRLNIFCGTGQAIVRIENFDGNAPPPEFSTFTLTALGQSVDVEPGTHEVPDDTDVTIAVEPASSGVFLDLAFAGGIAQTETVSIGCIVEAAVSCQDGSPVIVVDPGNTNALDVTIGDETFALDGATTLPFPAEGARVGAIDPFGLSINDRSVTPVGYSYADLGPDGIYYAQADFDAPICEVDVAIECGVAGDVPTGAAEHVFDLTGTPAPPAVALATQILDAADNSTVTNGASVDPYEPGQTIRLTATNGVWLNAAGDAADEVRLSVPRCVVDVSTEVFCFAGQPVASIVRTGASHDAVVTGGDPTGEIGWFFTDDVIEVEIFADDSVLVQPANPVIIEPPICEIDVDTECQAGQAVVLSDLTDTPDGTTMDPAPGDTVAADTSVTVEVDNGVHFTASDAPTITVDTPMCQITARITCQSGEGGPTGSAVLRADGFNTPTGTEISPPRGTTIDSGATVTITVNNGVHFTNSGGPNATLTAPACAIGATAEAVCVDGSIQITVRTFGAEAESVTINGETFPVSAAGRTVVVVSGLALQESYDIGVIPADPATAAATIEPITVTDRCTIEITATVRCISQEQVLITLGVDSSSTGSVTSLTLDGDVNLPFLVAPGDSAEIEVSSQDTFPEDISVPTLEIPTVCQNSLLPSSARLNITYQAVCTDDGDVVVNLAIEGSANVLALAVNGDDTLPYQVAPGELITVTVLTLDAGDTVEIQGDPRAPVCLAPTAEPTPEPTPEPTLPPAVILSFSPAPEATPEPTPEATPEPTPEATPAPTPEATPAPTPEATPEPTPDPTPEPAPEPTPEPPVEVDVADPVAIRQHGKTTVLLPAACDVSDIDLPGAVRLTREGTAEDGRIRFVAETATLDVGTYKETISCGGQSVEIDLFVYRQIGGARGEANAISRLALTGGVLTLVLIGIPGVIARREEELG